MSINLEVICYKYTTLKNGESPVKLRITKDRKRKYINLDISIDQANWDFEKSLPKSNCPNKEFIEKLIADKISEYRTKVLELKVENKEFTAYSLADTKSVKRKNITVGTLFLEHINNLKSQKRHGYAASMQQVYNSLLAYNRHLEIPFSDIDIQWLKRYDLWLRNEGKSDNTIGIRFRTLRAIYNLALEEEIVKPEHYPFKKFKVSKIGKETIKRAISKNEILQVINYKNRDKDYYTSFSIDLFTFSYLMGGINFADIAYLTKKNIVDNKLIYTRRKTSKLISLPLNEKALSIISSYQNKDNPYLFPILSCFHKTDQQQINRLHKVITKVNKALKFIGAELGINVLLTTYVARHSYATVLKRSGVSTSIISESLGHSSERITQIYLDSFENSQIDEAMKNLL